MDSLRLSTRVAFFSSLSSLPPLHFRISRPSGPSKWPSDELDEAYENKPKREIKKGGGRIKSEQQRPPRAKRGKKRARTYFQDTKQKRRMIPSVLANGRRADLQWTPAVGCGLDGLHRPFGASLDCQSMLKGYAIWLAGQVRLTEADRGPRQRPSDSSLVDNPIIVFSLSVRVAEFLFG